MNKIDEWTKLDKLDKIGLIGQNWTKMIIVLNITDKVEDLDKIGQNWQLDNIRELDSMMNKLKKKHELRDPDLKGKGFQEVLDL